MILPPHQRGNLTNAQWQHLQPLLPPEKPSVGRPNNDHRKTINGILWILRTGAPWRDLRLALWSDRNSIGTVLSLHSAVGFGTRFWSHCSQLADAQGKLNWEVHHVDGSVIRAHQHSAGAFMGHSLQPANSRSQSQVQHREALGRSKGG